MLLQDQVQLGIEVKVQLQIGISGQARVVGKIPYTCNQMIINQWILVTLKSSDEVLAL